MTTWDAYEIQISKQIEQLEKERYHEWYDGPCWVAEDWREGRNASF